MCGEEGVVAVVQGLRDSGLAVTLISRTHLNSVYRRKRSAQSKIPPPSLSPSSPPSPPPSPPPPPPPPPCRLDSGAQACDGRYTSSYQMAHCNVAPTSPPEDLLEFPPQRDEPSLTQGNFCVGPQRSVRDTFAAVRHERVICSRETSCPTEGFARSLRRYPPPLGLGLGAGLPLASATVSSELVQRLISYTQDKHLSRGSSRSARSLQDHPTRGASAPRSLCKRPVSPASHGSPGSPASLGSPIPPAAKIEHDRELHKVKVRKSWKRRSTPDRSKVSAAYEYLRHEGPGMGAGAKAGRGLGMGTGAKVGAASGAGVEQVRLMHDMRRCLRRANVGLCDNVPTPPCEVCPDLQKRLLCHSDAVHCTDSPPPLKRRAPCLLQDPMPTTSRDIPETLLSKLSFEEISDAHLICSICCQPLPLCLCKKGRAFPKKGDKIDAEVFKWVNEVPVFPNDTPENKATRNQLAKQLADQLKMFISTGEFEEKARRDILSCIDKLPMWRSADKRNRDIFNDQLADNLLDKLSEAAESGGNDLEDTVAQWLENIELDAVGEDGQPIDKDKILKNITDILTPMMDKPKEEILQKIMEELNNLPVNVGNKIKVEDEDKINYSAQYEAPDPAADLNEDEIWDWLETAMNIPPKTKKLNEKIIRDFTQKLNNIKSDKGSDENIKEDVLDFLNKLQEEGVPMNDSDKHRLYKSLLDGVKSEPRERRQWDQSDQEPPLYTDEYDGDNMISSKNKPRMSSTVRKNSSSIPDQDDNRLYRNFAQDTSSIAEEKPNIQARKHEYRRKHSPAPNQKVLGKIRPTSSKNASILGPEASDLATEIVNSDKVMRLPEPGTSQRPRRPTVTDYQHKGRIKVEVPRALDDFYIGDKANRINDPRIGHTLFGQTSEQRKKPVEGILKKIGSSHDYSGATYRSPKKSIEKFSQGSKVKFDRSDEGPLQRRLPSNSPDDERFVDNRNEREKLRPIKKKTDSARLTAQRVMPKNFDTNQDHRDKAKHMLQEITNYLRNTSRDTNGSRANLGKKLKKRIQRKGFQTSTPHKDDHSLYHDNEPGMSSIHFSGSLEQEGASPNITSEEKEYLEELMGAINSWIDEHNIDLGDPKNKEAQIKDLVTDILDRQRYLQLNPDFKPSYEEELIQFKYQVFKWLNKFLNPDQQSSIMPAVENLMSTIYRIPAPQLLNTGAEITGVKGSSPTGAPQTTSRKRAADILFEDIKELCDNLPFDSSTPEKQERANKLKEQIAPKLIHKIGELNMNPEVMNDDFLYEELLDDEIDRIFSNINIDLPNLKKNLIEIIKEARQRVLDENAGQLYKQKLKDEIEKTLPSEDLTPDEQAHFEVIKDNIADAFVNLHYQGDDEQKNKLKRKIVDEINTFCNDFLRTCPNLPIDTVKLNQDLYKALKNVPLPKEDVLINEVETSRLKEEVNNWLTKLPLKDLTGAEALQTNKMVSVLAKKLHDIEMDKDIIPDYEDKMKEDIMKWLKKLPLRHRNDEELNQFADKLIVNLRNTQNSRNITASDTLSTIDEVSDWSDLCECYPSVPPCSLSREDREHLNRIRERSRLIPYPQHIPYCKSKDASVNPLPVDASSQTDIKTYSPCSPRCTGYIRSSTHIERNKSHLMPSVASQVDVSPHVIVKEYYWDSNDSTYVESRSAQTYCPGSLPQRIAPCRRASPVETLSQQGVVPKVSSFTNTPCQYRPCRRPVPPHLREQSSLISHKGVSPLRSLYWDSTHTRSQLPCASRQSNAALQTSPCASEPCTPPPCTPPGIIQAKSPYSARPCVRKQWISDVPSTYEPGTSKPCRKTHVTRLGSFHDTDPTICKSNRGNYLTSKCRELTEEEMCERVNPSDEDSHRLSMDEKIRCKCNYKFMTKCSTKKRSKACQPSVNDDVVKRCSKCCGVHCPYPSYMFFKY